MASLVYGVVAVLTGIIAMLLACIYYIRDRDINLVWTFVVVSIVPLSMRLIGHVLGLSDPVQVGETTAKYFLGLCYPVLFIKCCVDCFNTSFEVDGVQIKIATPPLFARIGALTHYFYSSNQRQSPADGVPSSVVLSGHTGAIQALAFVPATDGPILASVGDDDTIRLWSVNTGKLRASLKIRSWAPALSVLPNGLLLTAGGLYHNSLRLWDVKQTPPACIKHIPGVNLCRALLAQPDGRIVCGDFEGTVSVFNLATGFRDAEMKGHTSWVTVLVKLRDGRVASSSWDHTIRVWNIASYHCEDVLKGHTAPVEASVQLHDGRLASGDTHEIRLWSINANGGNGTCTGVLLQADSERFKIDSDFRVQALVVLPDGRLASGHKDGNIRMWSLTAVGGSCDRIIKFRSDTVGYSTAQVSVLALLPGGRIAGSSDGFTIRIIDVPSS
jgi:WD40 repeat protein